MRALNCRSVVLMAAALALLASAPANADVIFTDSFDVDPEAAGWSESVTGDLSGAAATSSIYSTGSAVVMDKSANGAATDTTFSIARTVSTAGYESILIDLTAHQCNTTYENFSEPKYETPKPDQCDWLKIEYSTDGGATFEELLVDYGQWNGLDETPLFTAQPGNVVATATGDLSLSALADDNAGLVIRISTRFNAASEDYLLDEVSVSGTAIPEPGVLALLGLGAVGVIRRRR